MGKFSSGNNSIYQELAGALPGGIWSMPAYFNSTIYYGPVGTPLYAFPLSDAKLPTSPAAHTSNSFGYPGTIPSISANTNSNGIVWAAENNDPAVLHAYNAGSLAELYNSDQAVSSRDHFGTGNKFITPTIANGKVYVGTTGGVGVFGLLHAAPLAPTALSAGSVGSGIHPCDLNSDGIVNVQDVQLAIDMALGLISCSANVDGSGVCNVVMVQRIIDTALGGPCVTGPGVTSNSVSLSWTASASGTTAGYNVYRASAIDGPFTKLTATPISASAYTDHSAQAGRTYYYATTAVDANRNESAYSAAAQSVVP
jgi:hypothetical protein